MKMKKDNDDRGFAAVCTEYIKKHWRVILLIVAGYIAASALNFVNVATSQTLPLLSITRS